MESLKSQNIYARNIHPVYQLRRLWLRCLTQPRYVHCHTPNITFNGDHSITECQEIALRKSGRFWTWTKQLGVLHAGHCLASRGLLATARLSRYCGLRLLFLMSVCLMSCSVFKYSFIVIYWANKAKIEIVETMNWVQLCCHRIRCHWVMLWGWASQPSGSGSCTRRAGCPVVGRLVGSLGYCRSTQPTPVAAPVRRTRLAVIANLHDWG